MPCTFFRLIMRVFQQSLSLCTSQFVGVSLTLWVCLSVFLSFCLFFSPSAPELSVLSICLSFLLFSFCKYFYTHTHTHTFLSPRTHAHKNVTTRSLPRDDRNRSDKFGTTYLFFFKMVKTAYSLSTPATP